MSENGGCWTYICIIILAVADAECHLIKGIGDYGGLTLPIGLNSRDDLWCIILECYLYPYLFFTTGMDRDRM